MQKIQSPYYKRYIIVGSKLMSLVVVVVVLLLSVSARFVFIISSRKAKNLYVSGQCNGENNCETNPVGSSSCHPITC